MTIGAFEVVCKTEQNWGWVMAQGGQFPVCIHGDLAVVAVVDLFGVASAQTEDPLWRQRPDCAADRNEQKTARELQPHKKI